MFDFFKRKAKPSATATDESKPLWVELFDTQPVDSEGSLIALDDLVSYRGTLLQVVAMSHKQKVAEGIDMPTYAHEGDAGLDLRITETVTLEPMQKCVVGCGLAVEIPSGCVGLVFPRSGLAAKQGITLSNSVGVIDSGYRGEVCAALINQSYETVTLEAGTRVCQLVVMPYVPCELVPVDELSDTERGAGGFGSTGVE